MQYTHYPIINSAAICARLGVRQAVISPGSRNAPLTIAFARHPDIACYSVSDERAAAFIAMGMAQQSGSPVVLVCTSGSAGLNYAPAVAEAYFSQIPLLLLTADRPPEWVDQADGQTIRQRDMYGRHCKAAYEIPADYTHPDSVWAVYRTISEAIHTATAFPPGPVHVNMPFREPFYPKPEHEISFDDTAKFFSEERGIVQLSPESWQYIIKKVLKTDKTLLVAGQSRWEKPLIEALALLPFPLFGDIFSNIHTAPNAIFRYEAGLQLTENNLSEWQAPDLLITFGQSVLSKALKSRLRKFPPQEHWHIQQAGSVPDVFQSLTRVIRILPLLFFQTLAEKLVETGSSYSPPPQTTEDGSTVVREDTNYGGEKDTNYGGVRHNTAAWQPFPQVDTSKGDLRFEILWESANLNEPAAVYKLLQALPQGATLHLANSMPVRYAQSVGLRHSQEIEVFCNRGTSGIDGCVSTAVGHALASPEKLHVLLIGDVAFMYDRNALWHNYALPNLRIMVLNNGGGGIFRMIDGPQGLSETDEFLVTQQRLSARSAAEDAGFTYLYINNKEQFAELLPQLLADSAAPVLMEVVTRQADNEKAWQFIQPRNW
ncbi:2-succinyl-5-enolpyruvyl-6-hydroxy-3-cyclohexene-1-carboxylic-acid synthase [Rhodoflexus sp.]